MKWRLKCFLVRKRFKRFLLLDVLATKHALCLEKLLKRSLYLIIMSMKVSTTRLENKSYSPEFRSGDRTHHEVPGRRSGLETSPKGACCTNLISIKSFIKQSQFS